MGDKDVLRATTEIKIHELRRHEDKLVKHYAAVDAKLKDTRESAVERLRTLHDGVHGLRILNDTLHHDLETVPDLLELGEMQLESVGDLLHQRSDQIEREMQFRRTQWRHNKLLGELLVETLDPDQTDQPEVGASTEGDGGEWEMELSSGQVSLEKEREQAQKRLEEYFFTPCGKDRSAVREYLENEVFQRRSDHKDDDWSRISDELNAVRKEVGRFCDRFRYEPITCSEVASLADVLLMDKDQLSPSVVKILEGTKQNTTTQEELKHVLAIRLSNLTEFEWPSKGVPVVMKRAINGRYRSLIEEDAVTFLLFQFIGLKWSVFMKQQLVALLKAVDGSRQAYHQLRSVKANRIKIREQMMLSALPDEIQDADCYDESTADAPKKTMGKQDILRLICTEAHLLREFQDKDADAQRSMVAVVTDLEFFGPSVSHEVVLGIMEFLGVTPLMLQVFETHMKMPLMFPGYNEPRVMAKGVPVGRKSARFYSELVLFVMDYAVMARSGVFLYRTHDDICYFTREDSSAVAAWNEINSIVTTFGLRLNTEKSGSVRLWPSRDPANTFGPEPLPQQPIRWGLLELKPDASVEIVEEKVEWFAWELAQKLSKTGPVLRWITVYNKYMRFFLRNFGDASAVFGARHVDNMIEQVQHVHKIVFATTNGDVLEAVRAKIAANQPESSSTGNSPPAAWLYWPLDLGGLGLFNPLLELWSLKKAVVVERAGLEPFQADCRRHRSRYRDFLQCVEERGLQAALKAKLSAPHEMPRFVVSTRVSETNPRVYDDWSNDWTIDASYSVLDLQQFLDKAIAVNDTSLVAEYSALLKPVDISEHPKYAAAESAAKASIGDALGNKNYWIWVAYVHADELRRSFDKTTLVPCELLPAQLVDKIKKAGIYWS